MPMKEKEEYELIPMSPIRRLEKRVDSLESTSNGIDIKEFFHELVDIVRMNQQLVDELAKANDSLRIELSRLPGRLEELINNMSELLSYIKSSAAEESGIGSEGFKTLVEKLDQLIETNKRIIESNENTASALEEIGKKLRPPLPSKLPLPLSSPPKFVPR